MGLPSLFSSPEPVEKLYLSIILTEKYIQSAVWKFDQNKVAVIERSDQHPYTDDKDCIVQTDASLQELGKASESASEVVFGLEPSWVTPTGVADHRKPLLKKITQDLSLKAVGFVVIGEAVFQHLLKTQPFLTALFVELQETELRVSLVKQGKLLTGERVGRSGDTAADLAEGLARFDKAAPALAQLPSKIILYSYQLSNDELANEEQTILHHDWITAQTFLQPPLIEIVSGDEVLDAVAVEGGAAVGQSLGLTSPLPLSQADSQQEFGFAQASSELTPPTETPDAVATSFGIPIASSMAPGPLPHETAVAHEIGLPEPTAEPVATAETVASVAAPVSPKIKLPGVAQLFQGRKLKQKQFILVGFGLGLLALIIGGYLFLRFTATATLALQLRTQNIARDLTLTLDPTATTASETTLPVSRETKEIEGSKSMATTGVKLVGDKAKGKVTILNKTTSIKTFASGTVLRSGDLEFTLDQEVTVASASVTTNGTSETKNFGQAEANITAAEIGAESNKGKDTQFKIESFDENTYAATNPEPLTGGSSREVRVASEEDHQKLLRDLRTELLERAKTEFKDQAEAGTQLVPSGKITIQDSTYSAKVGDEVDNVSLEVTAVVEAYSYRNDQLQPLAEELLQSEVPENHELMTDKIQILSDAQLEVASNSSKVTLNANLNSEAKPRIDVADLKSKVEGQSLTHLASILGSQPTVANYTVTFNPSLAAKLIGSLPSGNRLTIEVK